MKRSLLVALALLATGLAASFDTSSAQAHGDPVTEYLPSHEVFVPFDLKAPHAQEEQLVALVDEANRAGFAIRTAVVWSRYDLGAAASSGTGRASSPGTSEPT